MPVRLHHAASDIAARIVLLGDEPIAPGSEALAQLVLEKPVAAAVGDRIVLRDTTAQRTIAGGRVLDLRAPARKRRTPERIAQLEASLQEDPAEAFETLLRCAPHYVDLSAFARDRAMTEQQVEAMTSRSSVIRIPGSALVLGAPVFNKFKQDLIATLAEFHKANSDLPGIGLERLRLQLQPRFPASIFITIIQWLTRSGETAVDGAWVRLPGHEVRLTPEDEKHWARIAPLISGAERFRPPRVRDIAGLLGLREADIRRLFKLMGRMGKVDEIAQDHFFLRSTVAEMVGIVVDLGPPAEKREFSAAQFRDRVDNGRKVAIQILEFFDRHGVTLRRGDLRRVNKHRLDLFRNRAEEQPGQNNVSGRESSPVGRPDFKSGRGRETVLGGFDSLSLPPVSGSVR